MWLIISGCGSNEPAPADPTPTETTAPTNTPEATTPVETPLPTDTPAPTATPTNTPTPIALALEIEAYYMLEEDGTLIINELSSPVDGWLAIYPNTQTEIDADLALGYIEIEAGVSSNLEIELDTDEINGRIIQVALHERGTETEFAPSNESLLLIETTEVDTPASLPRIEYETQTFDPENGVLTVKAVQASVPGWLLVTNRESDRFNPIGMAFVDEGLTENLAIQLRYLEASPEISLHLWEDLGEAGRFEADEDRPVVIENEPLIVSDRIELPFEIVVFDQPADDKLFVNRVMTDEPGFIVVYTDLLDDSQVDLAIGFAYVEAGLTENLEIDLNDGAATGRLLLTQHLDANNDQNFDFPGDDQMRVINDQIQVFPARTDQGGFIVVSDQPIVNNTITIRLVSVTGGSWIALFAPDETRPNLPGATLYGAAYVENGVSQDVAIEVEDLEPGDIVYARLHSDNGDSENFQPTRNDWPQQFDGRDIIIGFNILDDE